MILCSFRPLGAVVWSPPPPAFFVEEGSLCGLPMEVVKLKAGDYKLMCPSHDRPSGYTPA